MNSLSIPVNFQLFRTYTNLEEESDLKQDLAPETEIEAHVPAGSAKILGGKSRHTSSPCA